MAFRDWFKRKPKSIWTIKYTWDRHYKFRVQDDGMVTVFLQQDQFGNRGYICEPYGECKNRGWTFIAETQRQLSLWKKFGIVPTGAKDVVLQKLQA